MFTWNPDPASRVPDPTTPTKEEEVNKKICCPAFFVTTNLINFKISSFLISYSKKICANSLRTFIIYQKKGHIALKNIGLKTGIHDPLSEKTYSGSWGQKGTGSRIRIPNSAEHVV